MSILFKNADILISGKDGFETVSNGYLGVSGKKIDYIGKEAPEAAYDEVRDYTGRLLMPGLFNTHCHIPMTLLRGLGSDRPLQSWLFDCICPVEDKLTANDIYIGTQLGLLEMISTGTVSFTDMYYCEDRIAQACLEAGIKANLARPVQAFDPADQYDKMIRAKEAKELFTSFNGAGEGKILVDYSIHAEYTCLNPEVARRHGEECRAAGTRMHIHLSETHSEHQECLAKYGKTPAQWFADLGVFDGPAFAAHCVWVSDSDIQLMKEKGVHVAHNPSSNMKLASGFAPIEAFRNNGINVALGTDGAASNNNLNMFEEMHLASVIHNGAHMDPTIMKADYVLQMATINGAKLQGRPDTGELKVGCCADIIAIDMDKPHLFPNPDTVSTLCYSAQGSDVCMTMVDGKMLYENGEYLTMDKDRIMHNARKTVKRLMK